VPVEVLVAASPAWSAFESLLAQAGPQHPVVVIGTCHEDAEVLPDPILRFFRPLSSMPAAGGAAGGPSGAGPRLRLDVPSGTIEVTEPDDAAWSLVRGRTAHAAAGTAARAAAGTLMAQVLAEGQPSESFPSQPEGPSLPLPPVSSRDDLVEVERALQLFSQVAKFTVSLGRRLLADPRCRRAVVPHTRRRARDGGAPLAAAAARAAAGNLPSLDALQAALSAAADEVIAIGDPSAVHAASALLDDAEARCHALRVRLRLRESDSARLLAVAARRVTEVAEEQQQKIKKEAAAAAAALEAQTVEQEPVPEEDANTVALLLEEEQQQQIEYNEPGEGLQPVKDANPSATEAVLSSKELWAKEAAEMLRSILVADLEPLLLAALPPHPWPHTTAVQTLRDEAVALGLTAASACRGSIAEVGTAAQGDEGFVRRAAAGCVDAVARVLSAG
jgi:hypothetical protein